MINVDLLTQYHTDAGHNVDLSALAKRYSDQKQGVVGILVRHSILICDESLKPAVTLHLGFHFHPDSSSRRTIFSLV